MFVGNIRPPPISTVLHKFIMNKSLIILFIIIATTFQVRAEDQIEISNESNLIPFIGKSVRVRGIVTNTKCPSINGIDLWELNEYRGKLIEAEGMLYSWVESEEDIIKKNKEFIAHRGPGRFYRLEKLKFKVVAGPKR